MNSCDFLSVLSVNFSDAIPSNWIVSTCEVVMRAETGSLSTLTLMAATATGQIIRIDPCSLFAYRKLVADKTPIS